MRDLIERLEKERILLLDGAMGTELLKYQPELTNTVLANKSYPELVLEIHRRYNEAGVDIITTNTFTGTRLHLQKALGDKYFGNAVEIYNSKAVKLARKAANGKYIAGSIGPLGKPVAPSEDYGTDEFFISWEDAYQLFNEQAEVLKKAGIDFYLIETMIDLHEAAIALTVAKGYGLQVGVSFQINRNTLRTFYGNSINDIVERCENEADIIGINCVGGINVSIEIVREFRERTNLPLIAYPNAGIPDRNNNYPETPEQMARELPQLLDVGLENDGKIIVGGCCGTTPEHIIKFREVIRNYLN